MHHEGSRSPGDLTCLRRVCVVDEWLLCQAVDRTQACGAADARWARNRKTIEREIIDAEVRAGRIASGVSLPVLAKERLERLLDMAWRHMEEAFAAGDFTAYLGWFERSGAMAKALAPYQSPQYRAIAVAQTDMRSPALDLDKLSAKQVHGRAKSAHPVKWSTVLQVRKR
jgi:hypothetical protein